MRELKTDDPRVKAIREDSRVGWGSCTSIDECFEDKDLVAMLDCDGIPTPEAAVKWAYAQEGLFLEQALNARLGEDSDPELKAYRDWKEGK